MEKHYSAPWSKSLMIVSIVASVVLGGVTLGLAQTPAPLPIALVPLLILVGAAPFTIRGYTLKEGTLLVHRLLWSTRVPLAGLQSARFDPSSLKGSIRLFGNGGLFSFSGLFWNRQLGRYRAWATHPGKVVVLVFNDRRVVVSPGNPEQFASELLGMRRLT